MLEQIMTQVSDNYTNIMIIQIICPELTLLIHLPSSLDAEEWFNHCHVSVKSSHFSGSFECSIHRLDVVSFLEDLTNLHKQSLVPRTQIFSARFNTMEGDIDIKFEMHHLGKIIGSYALGNPNSQVLTGTFTMDQTYISPLLKDIEHILSKNLE
jgi:hypothetical protein